VRECIPKQTGLISYQPNHVDHRTAFQKRGPAEGGQHDVVVARQLLGAREVREARDARRVARAAVHRRELRGLLLTHAAHGQHPQRAEPIGGSVRPTVGVDVDVQPDLSDPVLDQGPV